MSTLSHKGNENSGRYPRGSGKRPYQHVSKQSPNDFDIVYKETGEVFRLADGEHIRNPKKFAGHGTSKPLSEECVAGLSREYPDANPGDWAHSKGIGTVDYYGEGRDAEIHWFEHPRVGKCKHKIKKWLED